MSMSTDTVGRLAVTWRPDADPDPGGRARLDGLVRALVDGGLPGGLGSAADRDVRVCVRRVELPVHRMRWDAADADLVTAWARVVERGVAGAVAGGGDEVVRYRSRAHARQDLVTAVLRGDRDRVWAWRLLDLWPGGEPGDDPEAAGVLRPVLAAIGRDEPPAAIGLLVAVTAAGLLPRFVAAAGTEVLAELVGVAWREAGGPSGTAQQGRSRAAAPGAAAPEARAPGADADPAVAELCALVTGESLIARALVALPTGTPEPVAAALARAAVLEAEPALAARPIATAVAAVLATRLARRRHEMGPDGGAPRADRGAAGADPTRSETARSGRERPGAVPPPAPGHSEAPDVIAEAGSAPRPAAAPPGDPAAPGRTRTEAPSVTARPASTGWGGLLFLLPLVAELDLPTRAAADPRRFGPGLRPVLHALARRIVARAVPDAGPADPHDPCVLAFAGLPPTAEPLRGPAPDVLEPEVDALVGLLCHRLGRQPLGGDGAAERGMLMAVCRRAAVIEANPGWIDVRLALDEVSIDVRRAGLDLDPGYLPWLGCIVRFRYG